MVSPRFRPALLFSASLLVALFLSSCTGGGGHHGGGGGGAAPAFTITKTHTGNFSQGQMGATYTVTVTNSGNAPTAGNVQVTDTVPAGETFVSATGTGWTCPGGGVCSRSDALTAGQSYPAITVTVNVSASASSPQVNMVSVGGGGAAAAANASDSTTINMPVLAITKTHSGNFAQGQMGATYTVTVSNTGAAATNGTPVEVTDTAPAGETLVSMAGTGWTCPGTGGANTCDRSDSLSAGSSYATITVTVNVTASASSPQVNMVSVSGGGSASANAMDSTTIITALLSINKTHTGNFAQGQVGATYTVTVSNSNAAGTGPTNGTVVTVTEMPPAGLTVTGMSGTGWMCPGAGGANTCTRSNVLAAGASYPAITVTVTVGVSATSPQVNRVSVSGGGSPTANGMDSTTILAPSLSITKMHTGNFAQGQMGATYTVTVSNASGANIGPTNGTTVTVTDTVPGGETLVSMTGTGWTCVAASCTRSDVLAAGASYAAINVTVNVAANASSPQVNMVSVAGGGSATANGSDSTIINEPVLSITKTHTGNFTQGQMGATYTVTVSNTGTLATSGKVTVTETVPTGLTFVSMTGTGWTCPGTAGANTCDRSDSLGTGSPAPSYPAITVTVNVAANAAASVTNMVTVSGGGSATANGSDMTTINPSGPPTCATLSKLGNESLLNGTYSGLVNAWNDPLKNGGGPFQAAFAFAATGSTGAASTNITNGEADADDVRMNTAQVASQHVTFTGCFNLGADLRGLMIWNFSAASGGGSATFAIAVRADGTLGELILFSDANPSTAGGTRGAGHFEKSVVAITATNGSVAFGLTAYAPNGSNPASAVHRAAFIGVIGNIVLGGAAANGVADIAITTGGGTGTQANVDNAAFTATFSAPDALGRGTAILDFPNIPGVGALILNYAYYVGGMEGGTLHIKLQSTDTPDNAGHTLNNGEAIVQTVPTGGFGVGSLNGNAVFQMSGNELLTPPANPQFTDVAAGLIIGNGSGGTQTYLDEVLNGTQTSVGTTTISGGSFSASTNGLGSVTFGASRAFSVAMIALNAGFILEGTQAASPGANGHILIGDFGPQTTPAGGFVDGTFSGLYIIATDHPSDPNASDIAGSICAGNVAACPGGAAASFSGKVDQSNTSGLASDHAVAATFAVDARGRNVVTLTSPSSGTAISWLRDGKNAEVISGTTDASATILRVHQ